MRRRVIWTYKKQRGRSNKARDKARKALKAGKRRSRKGKIYYERRKNRSDLRGNI